MLDRKAILQQIRHWKAALMGPVVTIVGLIYQQATGKQFTWGWFAAVIFAALWWQYKTELDKVKNRSEEPRLFLLVNPDYGNEKSRNLPAFTGEFLLQTEGNRNAFGVKITSEDAIGKDHRRITMAWAPQATTVGNDPVPVSVICGSHKGADHSSTLGSQVEEYMKHKVGTKELLVNVCFADIEGRPYMRKWRIYQERDAIGYLKTRCDPIKD